MKHEYIVVSNTEQVNDSGTEVGSFGARLVQERKRLGISQTDLRSHMGVGKTTQIKYENGDTSPDVDYLAELNALGFDVLYLLTGTRGSGAMAPEHQNLIDAYEAVPEDLKRAVFGVLLSFGQTELDAMRMAKRGESSQSQLPGEITPNVQSPKTKWQR